MRKNPVSQSAFFGSHVFFGLAIVLTGISLALVGVGRPAHDTAQSARSTRVTNSREPDAQESPQIHKTTVPFVFTVFFFSSRRRHTISYGDWSSDVCSSDLHRARG